jgi:ribonuclease BN (tRNA processing enzyme)
MDLTILGSGTVVPDGTRNSAGYFIESAAVRLMMDCGAGTVHALARYCLPWEQMTHLFISHFHVDHAGEMAALFSAFKHGLRGRRREPLTVIGPRGLDRVMAGLKDAFGSNLFETKFPVSVKMLDPAESFELSADARLSVAKTPHTRESLAVRVEWGGGSICYTGDTGPSVELATFFSRTDLLVSECSFRKPREGVPHLAIKDVAEMAARARAARLVVTHFYFDVSEQELKRELSLAYPGQVIVAKDGLRISV